MKTKTQAAQAAALIRKELKVSGITAKVTSENYSMGNSVNISLFDATPDMKALADKISKKYQYGHFDGMTDSYEHSNSRDDIPQAKFVFVRNEASDAIKQAIYDHLRSTWSDGDKLPPAYDAGCNVRFQGDYVSALVWRMFCDGSWLGKGA